jgi:DNA-binding protein HU-alpha
MSEQDITNGKKNMVKVSGSSGVGKAVKKTPGKAAPSKAAAVTPVAAVAVPPKVVRDIAPVVAGPEMKTKDLIDKVVKRAGVKKKDAKTVVEAMLAVLGEALDEGRELVVQPLGRIKVVRVKDTGNGRVLVCRVRQGGGGGKGRKEGLAEGDD